MATDDLKADLREMADTCSNPDCEVCDIIRASAAHIAELEAQLAAVTEERDLWKQSEATCDALYTKLAGELAARDGAIAAWLRGVGNGMFLDPEYIATAIASGDYAKGQTDAQQGD